MTQRKSSEERVRSRAIGRRLRALRGDVSQFDYASRLGITRSALANYELGRSSPPNDLLTKIKALSGVDLDAPPELSDLEDEVKRLVGDDSSSLTEDEWALLRILRLAEQDDVHQVIADLVERVTKRPEGLRTFGDPETTTFALARLIAIAMGKAKYQPGMSAGNAVMLAKALAVALKP